MPLVNPHGGGALRPLLLEGEARVAELTRAATLPPLRVSSREKGDIIMLGIGGFTPLSGFMTHADWQCVCDVMRTAECLFWPIPITLSADARFAETIAPGQDIALLDPDNGECLATMTVAERYAIDKAHECASVFRTNDPEHPGVKMVLEQGEVNLAGPLRVLSTGDFAQKYGSLFMTPAQTRAMFTSLGWSKIAAFQTRNPMHRSHEYLVKIAIEVCDGVLVHSLLGALKPGDIPAEVRTRAIAVLAERYFVQGTVVQAGYPLDMRYAGPREALLHALFRQNYGCSHILSRPRPRRRGQLLRPVRRTPHLRHDSEGVARDRSAQDRLDLLVLSLRRHGYRPHVSACGRRSLARVRDQTPQMAVGRRGRAARIQPARSARRPA